jgi:hypothetical protein
MGYTSFLQTSKGANPSHKSINLVFGRDCTPSKNIRIVRVGW